MFATRLNSKVEAFFSCLPDPLALKNNSFFYLFLYFYWQIAGQLSADGLARPDWSKGQLYMYPPVPLLSLALHKVIREEAQVIAILPWWPRRRWFPLVLQLQVDLPVMLPECDGLLLAPDRTEFPNLGEFRLATWTLMGDLSAAEAFQATICAAHRPSMRSLYHAKWRPFLSLVFSMGEGSPSPIYQNGAELPAALAT